MATSHKESEKFCKFRAEDAELDAIDTIASDWGFKDRTHLLRALLVAASNGRHHKRRIISVPAPTIPVAALRIAA